MSVVTKPVLLDSTGQEIAKLLAQQNGYLAMLASGQRPELYKSMKEIANIVRAGTVESNAKVFPIGDQIVAPWTDVDDSNKEYQVAWDIINHIPVTLATGAVVPGMMLQMHKCSAFGVQFDHQQAFGVFPEGLAAGTYHVTFAERWGSNGANAGTNWQFTLTKPLPKGGLLSGFESLPDVAATEFKVKSWAKAMDAEPMETVAVTAGASGTNLGTMALAKATDGGLNGMQQVAYGHNRWGTSALRQYLNAAGTGWFKPLEKFSIRPDQYAKHGFMAGLSEDFLSAIKPIKVTAALNTVEGFDTASEDTFDTFFLPALEDMNIKPQLAGEGTSSPYWRERMGIAKPLNYSWEGEPNQSDAFKIPALNANSPQNVRLRSSNRNNAYITWHVSTPGQATNNYGHASRAYRFSPVCVVC